MFSKHVYKASGVRIPWRKMLFNGFLTSLIFAISYFNTMPLNLVTTGMKSKVMLLMKRRWGFSAYVGMSLVFGKIVTFSLPRMMTFHRDFFWVTFCTFHPFVVVRFCCKVSYHSALPSLDMYRLQSLHHPFCLCYRFTLQWIMDVVARSQLQNEKGSSKRQQQGCSISQ